MKRSVVVFAALAAIVVPLASKAEPVVLNPFGNLTLKVLEEPNGAEPGRARLTVVTGNGAAFAGAGHSKIYFGLRIMGSEDMQMTTFRTTEDDNCIVSDFAGQNTPGWQGAPLFGTSSPVGSGNSHMRMVGGFLKQSCGNLEINVTFQARPLVAFYGAFFGYTGAPWHENYDEAPWSTLPTGGDTSVEKWWNLWGTFDTLGYSNACTNISGTDVSCG